MPMFDLIDQSARIGSTMPDQIPSAIQTCDTTGRMVIVPQALGGPHIQGIVIESDFKSRSLVKCFFCLHKAIYYIFFYRRVLVLIVR